MATDDSLIETPHKFSRRGILFTGAAAGMATAIGIPLVGERSDAKTKTTQANNSDIAVLNNALYYEHQAIWAYKFAAGKLTDTSVGKAVLAVATSNLNDHQQHRAVLQNAVMKLGGTPVKAQASYDLSAYIKQGEGNLDTDVNIAKLALALEVDATISYTLEAAKLKTPALITAGASIGTNEAAHATLIRSAFRSLGVDIPIVPASFFSPDNRAAWVLKV